MTGFNTSYTLEVFENLWKHVVLMDWVFCVVKEAGT